MSQTIPPLPSKSNEPSHWGTVRSSFTVVLFCLALILGVKLRSRLDARGIVIPPHTLSNAISQTDEAPIHIPLATYYTKVEEMLKEKYVEKVTDENALAMGAIKGMVRSLSDTHSYFYSPDLATAYLQRQKGIYEGIGVDLETYESNAKSIIDASALHPTSDVQVGRLPDLIINSIAPGSPADKAGLKPGDQINFVNGHWVVNQAPLDQLEALVKKAPKDKSAANQFNQLLIKIRLLSENSMTPDRAMQLLQTGTRGTVTVGILRNGAAITKTMQLAKTSTLQNGDTVAAPSSSSHGLVLRFAPGAAAFVSSQLKGQDVTFDLRNQADGSFSAMKRCLSLLLPSGTYGEIVTQRDGESSPLTIRGKGSTVHIHLLVDQTTRGAAAIFALILQKAGVAVLTGQLSSSNPIVVAYKPLPTGCAYTLALGHFSLSGGTAK